MLVDVHFDELELAFGAANELFQNRRKLLAGPAPFRPEVDQHRLAFGFLDDVLNEGLGGRILDQSVRRCSGLLPPYALQHAHFPPWSALNASSALVRPECFDLPVKWVTRSSIAISRRNRRFPRPA